MNRDDNMTQPLQLLIIHPRPVMQLGFRHLLSLLQLKMEVYCQAASPKNMLEHPEIDYADAIITELDGQDECISANINLLMLLQQRWPQRPLIILTDITDRSVLRQLLNDSATSVISLRETRQNCIHLVATALQGTRVISPLIEQHLHRETRKVASLNAILSKAELHVLKKLQAGYGVSQIAGQLCRSVKTISTHKRHIMDKLSVTSEVDLFAAINRCLSLEQRK
ncbi:response regulator transcription factor [Enterobacillus tribolii]|uniref:Two-component system capsular synthesis response regulator RcsB n=1 Tax=Enterobacillus tribolii TaxID=1487935 RepID=A0A370QNV5_9GAMM|nr:response regulator transcription factor [Enterobacillus tribolii]MBW7981912.1 response regulator transcription factor [Enterobacillus tribolii]RDK90067.1 two-component system capsular synthesis response regulator RcsB [Enterobacillus tribolii]